MVVFVDGDVPCDVERRRDIKSWLKQVAAITVAVLAM